MALSVVDVHSHVELDVFILSMPARHIKVVRPLYGVELFDGETARFEVEISEDDVHGQWKLNGEILSPSSVCLFFIYVFIFMCFNAHSLEHSKSFLSNRHLRHLNI
jgi:hypothetical protein